MLLLSWCALYIAFWNYKVSWFLIAYFNLSLLLTFQMKKFFCLKTFGTSLQKQQYCSFHGAPCIYHFRCRKCLDLGCWFSFDTSCPNSMFKTYLFLNFVCSAKEASIFFFLWSSVYILFNVQSVLILDCWFYFFSSYPNSTCKTFLFSKF